MGKPRYVFYEEYQQILFDVWRKAQGYSRKRLKRDGIARDDVLREIATGPGFLRSLEGIIAVEEGDYIKQGRRVLVPQDKLLLEMLWNSKMQVDIRDLNVFPRAFTIAWPRGTILDGVELAACFVWFGLISDRKYLVPACTNWLPEGVELDYNDRDPDEFCLHMTYGGGRSERYQCYRASVPESMLQDCLQSSDSLRDTVGSYNNPFTMDLSKEEAHKQYIHLRLILNLLVYATACPEAVYDGWPEHFGDAPSFRKCRPTILGSPIVKHSASHGSPVPHWRNPHFRQYPIRKDGSRRPGIVFVHGGMVNASLDPKTIKKVDKNEH